MNLQEYISHLTSYIASNPPDLGDEDSVLGILYEAHSETNAMYDDEIKVALGHANANTTQAIYAHQIARARAEASGVRAGVFSVLREA